MNREERTVEWLAEPGRLTEICKVLSNGGDLLEVCEQAGIRYSDVILWLNRDPGRRQAYETSLDARAEWMVRRLLGELKRIALVDVGQAYEADGRLKPIHEIPEEVRRCIAAVETLEGKDGVVLKKVRFVDKLKANELIGKHLRMFVEQHEHTVVKTLEDLVTESYDDATNES